MDADRCMCGEILYPEPTPSYSEGRCRYDLVTWRDFHGNAIEACPGCGMSLEQLKEGLHERHERAELEWYRDNALEKT